MENTIHLDGLILPYRIEYKRTRILKMRLKEGTICIVAPYYTSVQQIQELYAIEVLSYVVKYSIESTGFRKEVS